MKPLLRQVLLAPLGPQGVVEGDPGAGDGLLLLGDFRRTRPGGDGGQVRLRRFQPGPGLRDGHPRLHELQLVRGDGLRQVGLRLGELGLVLGDLRVELGAVHGGDELAGVDGLAFLNGQ